MSAPAAPQRHPAPRGSRHAVPAMICRAGGVFACALLFGGCGLYRYGHHAAPLDARPRAAGHSRATSRDQQQAESRHDPLTAARAQAAKRPDDPYLAFRVGQLEADARAWVAEEEALVSTLRIDARYAPAMSLLSKLYFEAGRHEDALRVLEPAVSHPEAFDDGDLKTLLAEIALHQDAIGRSDLAVETIRPIQRPDLHTEGSALVYVTLRGSYPDSAATLAVDVLHRDSENAVNLNNYGITQLRAGNPHGARKTFLSAIDREPRLAGPYYNLAILDKFYLMDDASAQNWFTRYWELSHDDPDSLRGVFARGSVRPVTASGN